MSKTVRGVLNEARELVIAGELAQARVLCEEVLARYPKHVEAHLLLGEAAREAGRYDDARRLFLTALALDPENGISYWALGLIAEQHGPRELALSLLERALEYLPGDSELWQSIRRLRGDRPELSRGGLGRLYLKQGLFHRARRELEAALEDQPSRLDLRIALAETLWRLGLISAARARCEEVLAASPDCLKALLILADCNRQLGRISAAERLLRRAAEVDPDGDLAAVLFVDADPRWIRREPVDLAPPVTEPPVPQALTANWIEELADATTPAVAAEPRLTDWFDYEANDEPIAVSETSLLEDESLKPWHDLLAAVIELTPADEARLATTLGSLGGEASDAIDGWREVRLPTGDVLPSSATASDSAPGDSDQDSSTPAVVDMSTPSATPGRRVAAEDEADDLTWLDDLRASLRRPMVEAIAISDDTVARLQTIVALHPDLAGAHRLLGDALVRRGDLQQAIEEYTRAFTSPAPRDNP